MNRGIFPSNLVIVVHSGTSAESTLSETFTVLPTISALLVAELAVSVITTTE